MMTRDSRREMMSGVSPVHASIVRGESPTLSVGSVDPLEEDEADDDVVVTTRRGICRIALVAVETADRIRREGLAYDPMSWLLAPRRIFDGETALDACLDRGPCMRAVMLHGLGLGLDLDPETLDELIAGDDEVQDEASPSSRLPVGEVVATSAFENDVIGQARRERLFTATIVANDGFETLQAFHASMAHDETEVAGRLFMRLGVTMADAVIVEGLRAGDPLVQALLAPAMIDTLSQVADDPASPLGIGLDVNVEQRFTG